MTYHLPISLVVIDNVAHELTRRALEDSLWQIEPAQILILTDAPDKIRIAGADYDHFDGRYIEVMRALWYRVPQLLRADHMIWQQWDSWVLDADQWTDEFFEYDYIGAPWPIEPGNTWDRLGYTKDRNVGNGGFSLRSRRLVQFLADHRDGYPQWLPEDDGICRKLRPALETEGFRWAPEKLAQRFSFECAAPPGPTFGFHGFYNWPKIMSEAAGVERYSRASPWIAERVGAASRG